MPSIIKSVVAGSQGFITLLRHLPRATTVRRVICYGALAPFRLKRWPSLSPQFQFFHTPRNMDPLDRFNLLMGRYETDERAVLDRLIPANIVIELGANIGVVSRIAFGKLKKGGHYICVEPNPNVQEALIANMRATQCKFPGRDFTIVSAIVCEPEKEGAEIDFIVRRNLSSGARYHLRVEKSEKTIKRSTRSLASIIAEYAPHDRGNIALVCDIEGAEIGLSKCPAEFARISQIALELHGPETTGQFNEPPEKVLARFVGMGFRPAMSNKERTCYLLVRDPA